MRVENVKVYDLEESIIASGYPMMRELDDIDYEIENVKYWLSINLPLINKILLEYNEYSLKNNIITMQVDGIETYISPEDLIKVSQKKWSFNSTRGYIRSTDGEFELHRFICDNPKGICIDHKDRNKLNNVRDNFRLCTHRENTINKDLLSNNSSGFTGVYWSKDKNKWYSKIEVNKKKIHLGYFISIEDAVISRLKAEKDLFGEFAPQRHLFEQYGIGKIAESSIKQELGFIPSLEKALKHYKRIFSLANTPQGSGHNQALTGVRVAFDLTFSNKAWVELERYRFVEFVSSQSTMHRITKLDIKKQCNKYVWYSTIEKLTNKVKEYNKSLEFQKTIVDKNSDYYKEISNRLSELYLEILYNVPSGFELTARLTTNYRALKTVYSQRKNHRLPEWQEFCKWVETLPYAKELIMI